MARTRSQTPIGNAKPTSSIHKSAGISSRKAHKRNHRPRRRSEFDQAGFVEEFEPPQEDPSEDEEGNSQMSDDRGDSEDDDDGEDDGEDDGTPEPSGGHTVPVPSEEGSVHGSNGTLDEIEGGSVADGTRVANDGGDGDEGSSSSDSSEHSTETISSGHGGNPDDGDYEDGDDDDDDDEVSFEHTDGPATIVEGPPAKPFRARRFEIARIISMPHKNSFVDPDFAVRVGDFVLVASGPNALYRVRCRNYAGQEGFLARHHLQALHRPWSIPRGIKLIDCSHRRDGEEMDDPRALPLFFTAQAYIRNDGDGTPFEKNEPVMISRGSANPKMLEVVDVMRQAGTLNWNKLRRRWRTPWNLLVSRQALKDIFARRDARQPRRSLRVIGMRAVAAVARGEEFDDPENNEWDEGRQY